MKIIWTQHKQWHKLGSAVFADVENDSGNADKYLTFKGEIFNKLESG